MTLVSLARAANATIATKPASTAVPRKNAGLRSLRTPGTESPRRGTPAQRPTDETYNLFGRFGVGTPRWHSSPRESELRNSHLGWIRFRGPVNRVLHRRRSRRIGKLWREVHAKSLGNCPVGSVRDDVVDGMTGGGALTQWKRNSGFRCGRVLLETRGALLVLVEEEAVGAEDLMERMAGVEAHERQLVRESRVCNRRIQRAAPNRGADQARKRQRCDLTHGKGHVS